MIHAFVTGRARLAAKLRSYRKAIEPDGMIWIGVESDLTDIVVRNAALPFGLVDVKVCAVDAIWSGLKFVIRRELRSS
jgi:hypothetical protein